MVRKSVKEMNSEVDNVTDWMVRLLLWILILCVTGVIIVLVLWGV